MRVEARSAAARAQHTPAVRAAARVGYAVNGLLNVMIGLLAIGVVGAAGGGADPNGALTGLAQGPGGRVLIWVIAAGMLALGGWQFASAVLARDAERKRRWMSRAKLVGKGLAYLAIAAIAIRIAMRAGSGGTAEEDITARALATPGGIVLVVLIGLVALAVGGYLVAKGVRRRFLDDLTVPAGTAGNATTVLGIVGYVARGAAIGIVGALFLAAAAAADPSKAGGLDDALAALAALPFGQALLIVIGVGFIAYGVYSIVRARYARL